MSFRPSRSMTSHDLRFSSFQILMRVHEIAPSVFVDKKVGNVDIICDIVGFRPARTGGVRVEKERLGGQEVIHAYGTFI